MDAREEAYCGAPIHLQHISANTSPRKGDHRYDRTRSKPRLPETMTALFVASGPAWERPHRSCAGTRARRGADRGGGSFAEQRHVVAPDRAPEERGEPKIAGYEAAGRVAAVGDGVDAARVGSRVMANTVHAFAEFAVAEHRRTLPIPEELSYEEGAALPTALLTEHGALRAGGFQTGQSVLITGATSAIGLIGIQIANGVGADKVLATTRSSRKTDLLTSHGAEVVIDTTRHTLTDEVRKATDGKGVDLVLDHVGGQAFADGLGGVRKGGTVVQIGRLDQASTTIDLDTLSYGRLTVRGVSFGAPDELAELLTGAAIELLPAVADGRVRPVIEVLPFDRADDAADLIREARARGKAVLSLR